MTTASRARWKGFTSETELYIIILLFLSLHLFMCLNYGKAGHTPKKKVYSFQRHSCLRGGVGGVNLDCLGPTTWQLKTMNVAPCYGEKCSIVQSSNNTNAPAWLAWAYQVLFVLLVIVLIITFSSNVVFLHLFRKPPFTYPDNHKVPSSFSETNEQQSHCSDATEILAWLNKVK